MALIFILLLGLFALLWVFSPGKTAPFLDEQGRVLETSIGEITTQTIGGVSQSIIIRGENSSNPVLLFLHGGPGSPEYALAKEFPEAGLEQEFVVCWWDQRGAGMSYQSSIPPESMNLQQMIDDTVEVAQYLQQRFGQEKIFIAGHSWGSFLGMHTIAQKPELFHAYIGIGQVTNQFESERLGYAYMLKKAVELGDKKLERDLRQFTLNTPEDITQDYLMVRSAGFNKLGVGLAHEFKSMFKEVLLPIITCKEYTLSSKWGYFAGMNFSIKYLFGTVLAQDLNQEIPRVDIPVYIVQGKYDYQVSYSEAKRYFNNLAAPAKDFYTFENSAHSPFIEEPERFHQVLREIKARIL